MFFCFFGAKIWPAAADTGELGWDLRDPTLPALPVAPDDSEEALAASPASPVDADEISVYV